MFTPWFMVSTLRSELHFCVPPPLYIQKRFLSLFSSPWFSSLFLFLSLFRSLSLSFTPSFFHLRETLRVFLYGVHSPICMYYKSRWTRDDLRSFKFISGPFQWSFSHRCVYDSRTYGGTYVF